MTKNKLILHFTKTNKCPYCNYLIDFQTGSYDFDMSGYCACGRWGLDMKNEETISSVKLYKGESF